MANTAQNVFELSMALMDELNEAGEANTADNAEYKNRTLNILNVLQGELFPFSDRYAESDSGKGRRPIAKPIISFEAVIESLDEFICTSVLPYGLAAHLLMDENPAAAGFFQQRYEELKRELSRGLVSGSEDITDLYGGIEYGEFSHW